MESPSRSRTRLSLGGLSASGASDSIAAAGTTAANIYAGSGKSAVRGYTTAQGAAKVGSAAAAGFASGGPIGAGIGAATAAIELLLSRKGPKQRIASTKIANTVEPLMQQNLAAYLSGPHNASTQGQALANFDTLWQYLLANCEVDALGAPGEACVEDRQEGDCKWKASPGGWAQDSSGKYAYTPAGAAGSGTTCWNWFVGYRDPIAKDPSVTPDPVTDANGNLIDPVTGQLVDSGSSLLGGSTGLLLAIALIGGALFMGTGKGKGESK